MHFKSFVYDWIIVSFIILQSDRIWPLTRLMIPSKNFFFFLLIPNKNCEGGFESWSFIREAWKIWKHPKKGKEKDWRNPERRIRIRVRYRKVTFLILFPSIILMIDYQNKFCLRHSVTDRTEIFVLHSLFVFFF